MYVEQLFETLFKTEIEKKKLYPNLSVDTTNIMQLPIFTQKT